MFDFFSSNTKPRPGSTLSTSISQTKGVSLLQSLVQSATDPNLNEPHWEKNLDICDKIKATNNTNKEAKQIARYCTIRLQSSDKNVVFLTLKLIECCMKNCEEIFAASIDQLFMTELLIIASSSNISFQENSVLATNLLQEWNDQFGKNEKFPIFRSTYDALQRDYSKNTGYLLRDNENHSNTSSNQLANAILPGTDEQINKLDKLDQDLNAVNEQIIICQEILTKTIGIENGDMVLSKIIGYLEACQERMLAVIEAGSNGLLTEELFSKCLKLNDSILKTLEAEKNGTFVVLPNINTSNSTIADNICNENKNIISSNDIKSTNSTNNILTNSQRPTNTSISSSSPSVTEAVEKTGIDDLLEELNISSDLASSNGNEKTEETNDKSITTATVLKSSQIRLDEDLDSFLNSLDK